MDGGLFRDPARIAAERVLKLRDEVSSLEQQLAVLQKRHDELQFMVDARLARPPILPSSLRLVGLWLSQPAPGVYWYAIGFIASFTLTLSLFSPWLFR